MWAARRVENLSLTLEALLAAAFRVSHRETASLWDGPAASTPARPPTSEATTWHSDSSCLYVSCSFESGGVFFVGRAVDGWRVACSRNERR